MTTRGTARWLLGHARQPRARAVEQWAQGRPPRAILAVLLELADLVDGCADMSPRVREWLRDEVGVLPADRSRSVL